MVYTITRLACAVALLAGVAAGAVNLESRSDTAVAARSMVDQIRSECRAKSGGIGGEYRMHESLFCMRYEAVVRKTASPAHPMNQCEACVVQCADPDKPYKVCMQQCGRACALF